MTRFIASRLLLLAVFVTAPVSLFAQATATGTVVGTITDSSQAVVAGAEVSITQMATGSVRTSVTNSTGSYRFDLLQAGNYVLSVKRSGFATETQKIELLVGTTETSNFSLKPGAASETVEVQASNPIVDIEKTNVGTSITPSEVLNMPMVGQDVANLAYLAPGVKVADSYDPTKNRYAILSVNGDGGRNVNVTINGVDNKDNTVGGPVMQMPLEGVQEYYISTQRFSAENGRSEGASINIITKRGTNKFHGSFVSYFRDAALNTDEKEADGTGGQVDGHPDYSRQKFGGSIGGPFLKDKAFGFFAFEREREHQGLPEEIDSYNQLVAAKNAGLAAEPSLSIPRPFYENRYGGRADYTFTPTESAYVSFWAQANNSENDQSDGTGDLTNGNFTINHLQIGNLTLNSVLSNTTVNTFTLGWQYWNNLIASDISAPLVTFPGASFGTNTNVPQQSFQRKWQFKDDFSKTIGKHALTAGVDFINNPVEGGFFEFSSTLEIDFGAKATQIATDTEDYPQGFATPGAVVGMAYANGDPTFLVATKQIGLYAQDDWKVNRRLTLNLGLRWDKDINMIGGSKIKQSRTYLELVALNSPWSNPYVSSIAKDDNLDFSPRVGFAYDLTGKGNHVLRGGYGLYYGNVFQNIPLFMEQMANATVFQTVLSLSSPSDSVPGTGETLGQWRYGVDPMPTIPPPSTELASGSVGRLMDPHYRNPITEEFNIGYTWAINSSAAVEAEYVHVLGIHGNRTVNIDQKIPVDGVCCTRPLDPAFAGSDQPELASVRNEEAVGREHYDGINFTFKDRIEKRFTAGANYTLSWANGYDTGGSSFRNYARNSYALFAPYEWGPSPNDERSHVTVYGLVNLPKGFELSPILQYGSARPWQPTAPSNTLNTGGGTTNAVVVPKSSPTAYFTYANDIASAQDCYYGLSGSSSCTIAKYDLLRGDPIFELDMRLAKSFKFGDRVNLQLIAEAYNLTNRANYGNNIEASISDQADFGKPAGFFAPSATTIPRSVWGQFGFRLSF
ncbi:TonB-dependent receptor [Terracidiphilus gabretensis]|uniref:TonB-dependent receptor n=1 Tax=Terracidiphilus gabretensis TaxID=1577687 RepID=UPI00071BC41B|nr:TonB-dependent receptor [Terracidiphilus gabretensis]